MKKTLEQTVAAFDEKAIRSAISVYSCLKRHGYEISDLEKWNRSLQNEQVRYEELRKKEVERRRKEWESIAPLCPKCGKYLSPPKHVCKKKGPENLKGWTCLWYCENGDCVYERYTYEEAREEMNKLIEGRKN